MRGKGFLVAAMLSAGLAACGAPKEDSAAPAGEDTVAVAASSQTAAASESGKPASFAQCVACHAVEKGKHGIGPSLAGVYGTKAGEIAGFAFSEPLKASGLTWDDATLDKWLAGPMKLVPGTRMTYAGMQDAARRTELIENMKTLK
jgi:cytochrome c